jgi:hypothetical protein
MRGISCFFPFSREKMSRLCVLFFLQLIGRNGLMFLVEFLDVMECLEVEPIEIVEAASIVCDLDDCIKIIGVFSCSHKIFC